MANGHETATWSRGTWWGVTPAKHKSNKGYQYLSTAVYTRVLFCVQCTCINLYSSSVVTFPCRWQKNCEEECECCVRAQFSAQNAIAHLAGENLLQHKLIPVQCTKKSPENRKNLFFRFFKINRRKKGKPYLQVHGIPVLGCVFSAMYMCQLVF
jgi:hypothetical protein